LANSDYYNVLGVSRKASSDEIKRAYRSLAMRWHPDRNASDPMAESRFKDINEAYKTLSDPERRVRYDKLGPLYTFDGRPPRPEEVQEAFGNVISNLFGRRKKGRGEDLRYTLSLSLEEILTKTVREVVVPREVRCTHCAGEGAEPNGGKQTCAPCNGSGKGSGPRLFRSHCYHCEGRGFVVTQTCVECHGDTRVTSRETLRVTVPAGVATGQKLKLTGKGNMARGVGSSGDLFVLINIANHSFFRRRGDDLIADLPLTYAELVLGGEATVPTLEGSTVIKIMPGTSAGKVLRLGGRGLPRLGRAGRGDLHLQVELEIPQNLRSDSADLLQQWSRDLKAENHPRRAAFNEAVRRR
jgi:molecular chaperone DnaJ